MGTANQFNGSKCENQNKAIINMVKLKAIWNTMVFCYQNCSDLLWEKKYSSDQEKLLKFEDEGWELAKFLT